jgi:hypothetical protein
MSGFNSTFDALNWMPITDMICYRSTFDWINMFNLNKTYDRISQESLNNIYQLTIRVFLRLV